MSDTRLDIAALENCLESLQHLFIENNRLKREPDYEEKRGGYGDVSVSTLDSGTPTSKRVATKAIHLRTRHKEPQRLAFRLARELQIWAGLRHPHILPLLGYYLDKDYKIAVLISEYMVNGDLKDYIEGEKPSWDLRLSLVRDSTDGLAYLHNQNPPIRHGDLKPGNVLVNSERRAKLADFGLSKALEDGATRLTTSNGTRGTLRYSSPELLKETDTGLYLPSDIWAWACLAIEALTDRIPYAEKITEYPIIMALINGEVPSDIESLPISIQNIKQLLAQCWALEPRERPSALNCLDVLNTAVHASQMDGQVASAEVQHDSLRQDLLNGAIPGATRSPGSGALTLADPGGDPSLASTSSSAGYGLPRTPGTDRRTLSLEPQELAIITVTADAKNYLTVDITGAESAAFVRKRIFSTLQIPEDDQENYQIYRTELGEGTFGDPLTDEWLMIYCGASADAEGTLKFIVQRNQATIKWVKGELIGENTYSRVFLAFNVITGEMMAVKQVELPQNIKDQDDVRQVSGIKTLESEQQTLAKLEHPNIVQYLGFEKTKECLSLFLEYVPGGSIGSCLGRGKFAEDVIKSFTGQIIDGLAYLHANKIIHRNVKADTVLMDASGICKLADFAISVHTEEMYKNTIMNTMEGSLFWMAPEMLYNDNKGYSAKVDIWSLGCAFIEMFSGRRPWEEDDFVSVLFKVGRNRMAPPVPNDVELSTEAEDFRLKCFNPDSDARPTAEGLKGHPWLTLPPGWVFQGLN